MEASNGENEPVLKKRCLEQGHEGDECAAQILGSG